MKTYPLAKECQIVETGGLVTSARMVYIVDDIAVTGGESLGTILWLARSSEDIPPVNSPLTPDDPYSQTYWVRAKTVRPSLAGLKKVGAETRYTVRIEVDYEYWEMADTGAATPGEVTVSDMLSGGARLNQIRTEKDRNGNNLVVRYTPPDGNEQRIIAEATVPVVVGHCSRTFCREITSPNTPEAEQARIINKVNSEVWRGGAEKTWLCTNVAFEALDRAHGIYRFTYEFEYNPDKWRYTVIYHDSKGDIPSDITSAGKVTFDWHDAVGFKAIVGP